MKHFILGATVLFFFQQLTAAANLKGLPGHVPQAVRQLVTQGLLPGTNELTLAIGLPLRDPVGLKQFLADVYDPASVNYRKFLTPEEFTARFGPTESDYELVKNFARTSGLTITGTFGNRLLLDVRGSTAAVEKAFHVTLRTYRHPTENRIFYAPNSEPTVDASLPIADVSGLDNYSRPKPLTKVRPDTILSPVSPTPLAGSGSGGAYFGGDFRAAYAPGTPLTGAGQVVGHAQFDGFYSNDILAYATAAKQPVVPVQTVLIDGVTGNPLSDDGSTEVSLDIEMAMSMAPGLSRIIEFEGSVLNNVLNVMAASNTVKNLSMSWGFSGGPSTTTQNILQQMAAQGQSFFVAAGDDEAFPANADGTSNFTQPATSPYLTVVGGTTLTTGPGAAYASETAWNWGGGTGTGGGISSFFSIPDWQANISMASNGGSTTKRNAPDVALIADNVLVYDGNGSNKSVGGTSVAAPLWAGFAALLNQQANGNGQPSVGFINPAIYTIAGGSNYAADFHDVNTGNNVSYSAVTGYDLCTGLGTPAGTNLINDLTGLPDAFAVAPGTNVYISGQFGGPFAVSRDFTLVNSGDSSLDWSAGGPAWLTLSASNGILAAGAQATVTATVNGNADTLPVGVQYANVNFTNQSSGGVQTRQLILQVRESLVISPTTNLSFVGVPGGPFTPTSRNLTLTNLSSSPLSWQANNSSSWVDISPTSGTLPANGQAVVVATLNSAADNLTGGAYNATINFTNQDGGPVQKIQLFLLAGELVQNGGFETGDFAGWTLTGDGGTVNFVDDGSWSGIMPRNGSYEAALGQVSTLARLTQVLPTVVGQKYRISLWLDNPLSGSSSNPNQLQILWIGAVSTTLFSQQNLPQWNWTNLQFIVTANKTSTTLQIGARQDNSYFLVDDVSVTPGSSPVISFSPTNVIALSGGSATFNATVTGTPPLGLQWRKNSATLPGATNNTLALFNVTTNDNGSYQLIATNAFGSAANTATLSVYPPPTLSVGGSAFANSSFTLNFSGAPGYTYILQVSTNLFASDGWQDIATNTFDASGLRQYTDTQITNSPQQFYRLKLAQ